MHMVKAAAGKRELQVHPLSKLLSNILNVGLLA
jgi:hypothetical protein